jgi:hypothetical protein
MDLPTPNSPEELLNNAGYGRGQLLTLKLLQARQAINSLDLSPNEELDLAMQLLQGQAYLARRSMTNLLEGKEPVQMGKVLDLTVAILRLDQCVDLANAVRVNDE